MARIVSLGSALQDIYLIDRDDLTPTSIGEEAIFGKILVGSKVDIDKLSYEVGGGGVNSAITFARNGHEVILMSNVAHDSAGNAILKVLDREGIDSSYVDFVERKATGTSVVLLDTKSGERTILTYRGASEKFDNFNEVDLDLIQPDWLYVTTLRGDMETLLRFFEKAKSMGIKIMFNPGVKELNEKKKLIGLLSDVDVLLVNKSEAAEIVPGVLLTELLYHLNNYVETVIITDGAMGGIAMITADHGNAEEMSKSDGSPMTAHTTNLVYYILLPGKMFLDIATSDLGAAFDTRYVAVAVGGVVLQFALAWAAAGAAPESAAAVSAGAVCETVWETAWEASEAAGEAASAVSWERGEGLAEEAPLTGAAVLAGG